ncbi:class I SAM-dependent methyltransferase [Nonomuraea sp. NPDC005692]|uniref:class I SAM-dependent methyltransferase n=1 Tax=Nonomuraea sp. NPDC005692 TaxID=3157168 RepID=UPI0033CAC3D8
MVAEMVHHVLTQVDAYLARVPAGAVEQALHAIRRCVLVSRTSYGPAPARMEYALTDLGRSLRDQLTRSDSGPSACPDKFRRVNKDRVNKDKRLDSVAGYAEAAEMLAEQYESVTFAEVHREVLHVFPARPSRVLDVGAGSGRDAAALAALGHTVVAAEPTAELRALGERLHADQAVEWVDDALPDLARLREEERLFDLVLLTAVWMHLDEQERAAAMPNLVSLLAPGGRVVLSLRHGPVPDGRRMFAVSAQETIRLARTHGLDLIHLAERVDPHGRRDVSWTYLALQMPARTQLADLVL